MNSEEAVAYLWVWSNRIWSDPRVESAVIRLQDRYYLNANAVLWAIWSADRGYRFADEEVRQILNSVQNLEKYGIDRLREVRRYLTAPKVGLSGEERATLRTHLLTAELYAERLMQARLVRATVEQPCLGDRPADADAIARMHFAAIGTSIERPLLISQSGASESAEEIFEHLLGWIREKEVLDDGT